MCQPWVHSFCDFGLKHTFCYLYVLYVDMVKGRHNLFIIQIDVYEYTIRPICNSIHTKNCLKVCSHTYEPI